MFKYLIKISFTYLVLLAIFIFSLFITCKIPSSVLTNNIEKSIETFKKEGIYPSFGLPFRKIVLDNFTDSLMLNTAYTVDSKDAFKSAMINLRYNNKIDSANQILSLEKALTGVNAEKVGYERYWHGYLVYLRPLLIFLPYAGIRTVLFIISFSTFGIFIYLCYKKLGLQITAAFIFGFISVDFFYVWKSMQFTSVFIIGLITSIYIILKYSKNKTFFSLFFIVGGLTSFFDLMSAPIVTLGIPLIVVFILRKEKLIEIFKDCFYWSSGYLLLWFSKWILVQSFFAPGAINSSFNQILNRTINQANTKLIQLEAIKLNFFQLIGYDRSNKFFALFFLIIYSFFILKYLDFKIIKFKKSIGWIIIGLIPYFWYVVVANQSYLHVWFTYRDQLLSIVSFFMVTFKFIKWHKVKKDILMIKNVMGWV